MTCRGCVPCCQAIDGRVVGYYAIAVANVTRESAPARVAKNAPDHVPCLLLARLAVDRDMQGYGLHLLLPVKDIVRSLS